MASATADIRSAGAAESSALRVGTGLMTLAALGFIGYAIIFFVRNFTDSFLELGIGPNEVDVGKGQIVEFSPAGPVPLHRPPPHRSFGIHRRHGTGSAFLGVVRSASGPSVGLGGGRCRSGARTSGGAARALPQ